MQNQYLTHSSTDNFGSPIPVSDWLIFCSGYLMLRQKKKKKKNENDKKTNFMMKMCIKHYYCELVPLTRDVTCFKLQRDREI